MKNLFLTSEGAILFDTETQKPSSYPSDRQNIRRIYLINESTKVVCSKSTGDEEVYAEEGDIVIEFYDNSDFKYHIVVAKSAQWADNIKNYRDAEQKRKEEWAAKQKAECGEECDACSPSCSPF